MIELDERIISRAIYRVTACMALPLVLSYFYWRGRHEPAYRKRWAERLGFGASRTDRPIWIHAASVGEAALAEPLVRALHERDPGRPILVTTFTPTGAERVRTRLAGIATHRYLPLDTTGATRRFMRRINPSRGVIIETELWPNLLRSAASNSIPILLANASISERSAKRYGSRLLLPLMQAVMADISAIGAASQEHAARFAKLGAADHKVHVTGNLKYDITPDPKTVEQGAALRAQWQAQSRPVWVAASTHEGEEAIVLAAHRKLQAVCKDALLILAPRHPQRFDAVADMLDNDGWKYATHADNAPVGADTEVIFGNTLGDVPRFYASADIAFVGGSLVPGIGGHNLLEAALLARPILVGPHINEWQEITDILVEAGGAAIAQTPEALAGQLEHWFADADEAQHAGQRARSAAQNQQGALDKTCELLTQLVSGRAGAQRSRLE